MKEYKPSPTGTLGLRLERVDIKKNKHRLSVYLNDNTILKIDKHTKKKRITKTTFIRQALIYYIEHLKSLKQF